MSISGLGPTGLVKVLRRLINQVPADDQEAAKDLAFVKKAFDELDRQLSMGIRGPSQWNPHHDEAAAENLEYWRGR